jgi:hypothetical protein
MSKIDKTKNNKENNIEKKFEKAQSKTSDKSKDSDKMKKKRDFSEKVIKFIQYDDLIKETMLEHRKQINELKIQKKELELFLIDYLEEINNDVINCGESDVIKKVEKQKKAPLNKTLMKKSIIEDMIKEKFIKTEEQGEKIIEKMFENMENKRTVTNVIELKRKSIKPKK